MRVYRATLWNVLGVNSYFVIDEETKHGFAVDPGGMPERLLGAVRDQGWVIEKILLTHGHFDHIGAVDALRSALGIPVMIHEKGLKYLLDPEWNLSAGHGMPDGYGRSAGPGGIHGRGIVVEGAETFREGDRIALASDPEKYLSVLHTPGHTEDGCTFYCASDGFALTGDTIFRGTYGAVHFPGGDGETLLRSIREKILSLPDDTVLYPGHNSETTVAAEKWLYM